MMLVRPLVAVAVAAGAVLAGAPGASALPRGGFNSCATQLGNVRYRIMSDPQVLDQMLEKEVAPGLLLRDLTDKAQLRSALLSKQAAQAVAEPLPIPVSPQRKRQTARTRLNERTMSVASRVLQDLEVRRNGFQLTRIAHGPRQPNIKVITRLLNAAVTADLGDARQDASAADLGRVFDELDEIADRVRDDIRKQL